MRIGIFLAPAGWVTVVLVDETGKPVTDENGNVYYTRVKSSEVAA